MVVKSEVVKSEPVVKVVKSLQPNPVVKNESLQPTDILQPANSEKAQSLTPQQTLQLLTQR
jgi:hypothetical protein